MAEMMRRALLIFASAALGGCVIIPIPTPELGTPLLTRAKIEEVEAGVGSLTREQVVAVFGEPQESYADDRVVLYGWDRSQGIYLLAPAAGSGDVRVGRSEHRICLRYSATGVLEGFQHFDSAVFDQDQAANKLIRAWIAEIGGWPAGYPVLWEDRKRFPEIDHVTLNAGTAGPATLGSTTFAEFIAILGRPARTFGDERFALYQSSDPNYFQPVSTDLQVSDYGTEYRQRKNYYALLAGFDSQAVLQDMQVVEWWHANGPHQLAPLVADAFDCPAVDLRFVRPFDGGRDGLLEGGVYVATADFVGAAAWKRTRYEMVWKHPYAAIESVSSRQDTSWLTRRVRIQVRLHSGETIEIEPFEVDFDAELEVTRDFADLVAELLARGR